MRRKTCGECGREPRVCCLPPLLLDAHTHTVPTLMSTVLVSDGENWNFVQFKKLRAGSLTTHQTAATTIPVRVHNLDSLPWKWKGQLRRDKPKKQLACLKRYSYVLKLICRHSLVKTNILDNIQVYFISNFFFIPVQSGNLHTPKTWGCHKKYNFLKNSCQIRKLAALSLPFSDWLGPPRVF